jgi:hypothetical protein
LLTKLPWCDDHRQDHDDLPLYIDLARQQHQVEAFETYAERDW